MHVLDHGGNLVDACMLSALAACMAFRRPEVVVGGGPTGTDITMQPRELREPLPLTIHHFPLSTTFALFGVRAARARAGCVFGGQGGAEVRVRGWGRGLVRSVVFKRPAVCTQ